MREVASPPTARAIDVVEFLAHRGEPCSFSSIVRELDLSQATAHAILRTLTDRGWVSRAPADKRFSLGPALATLTTRAHAAQAAAADLWRELGHATSVIERSGDSLRIIAFNGGTGPAGVPSDPIPFTPPFGVAFAAWAPEPDRSAWVRRGAGGDDALRHRLDDALVRTRARGYDVDWTTPALSQTAQLLSRLERDGVPSPVGEIIDQLLVECLTNGVLLEEDSASEPRTVATIGAPVFGPTGQVALLVAAHPLTALRRDEVEAIGRRLIRATAGLS